MKKSRDLRIDSSILSWLAPTIHGTVADDDPRMQEARPKILQRDDYTCHYCQFRSEEYQEVHHFNHDHNDFSESNLTTVCPICHQVFHLSTCSQSTGGTIIALSDDVMTQVELNSLCRMLFVARSSGIEEWVNISKYVYNALMSKKTDIDSQISAKGSEPMIFAEVLQTLPPDVKKEEYMSNFKLLPKYHRFENIVGYWRDNVYKDMPVDKWINLIPTNVSVKNVQEEILKK